MPFLSKDAPKTIDVKIMSAALNLFVENGYHNVTVHDIKKRAEVSVGAIYHHFGSKEGVASKLFHQIIDELEELIDNVTKSTESPSEQCKKIIKQLFEHTESHPNIIAFVFHAKHTEFLSGDYLVYNAIPFIKMREIIAEGIKCGEFVETDMMAASSCVYGGAIRMIQLRLDGIIEKPITEYYDTIVHSALAGLLNTDYFAKKVS